MGISLTSCVVGLGHGQLPNSIERNHLMRKLFSMAYFTAVGMEIPSLSQGIEQFTEEGGQIQVHAKTATQLFDENQINRFCEKCLESDIVIIGLHGGRESFPGFKVLSEGLDELKKEGRALPWIHIQPSGADEDAVEWAREWSTCFGTPVWDGVSQYLDNGGAINFFRLLLFLESEFFQLGDTVPPAVPVPFNGIYHPDIQGVPDIEDYLRDHVKPGRITVGLWFSQIYWLNNDVTYIDAMIRSAERLGANVIPVFHMRYKDESRGNPGAEYVARTFFMKDGTPHY